MSACLWVAEVEVAGVVVAVVLAERVELVAVVALLEARVDLLVVVALLEARVDLLAAAALLDERTDLVEVAEAEVTLFDRPDEPHPAIRTVTTNPPATKRQLTSPDYAPYTSINRS